LASEDQGVDLALLALELRDLPLYFCFCVTHLKRHSLDGESQDLWILTQGADTGSNW
jgi:hypothetical protein